MQQTQQRWTCHVRSLRLFLAALALATPGCASVANFAAMRSIPVASPENPVVDFACIWQQGDGRDQRGRPCRGFCGQLMFITKAGKKPGIVRGAVSIYVFDNVGTLEEQSKPYEVFHFTADEWATFQRRTNLGMTYQLFVPYTRPGGHEAECQLHVKFTPEGSSSPLFSQPDTIGLTGSSGASAVAGAIDRKLTSSSRLFSNSATMPVANSPQYSELLKKMQEDARPMESRLAASVPPAGQIKPSDLQRLQATLDATTSRRVEQADYEERPDRRRQRVSNANYEETVDQDDQTRRRD